MICSVFIYLKFYENLKVFDNLRNLNAALWTVIKDIRYYIILVIYFIIAFSSVFYIANFWYLHEYPENYGDKISYVWCPIDRISLHRKEASL